MCGCCVLCAVCAVRCVCCEWHNMCAASAKLLPDIQVTDGSDGKAKEISSQTNQPLFMQCWFEFLYFCIPAKTTLAYKISHQVFFMQRWFHQKSQKGNLIFRFNTKFPRFLWSSDLISEIHVYLCVASINSGTNWICKCKLYGGNLNVKYTIYRKAKDSNFKS